MSYMNHARKELHNEIVESRHPHSEMGQMDHHYIAASAELIKALPKEHDVRPHLDVFMAAHNRLPTPDDVTGVGREQAAGIERHRDHVHHLVDEIKKEIVKDIKKG